ncbi:haloacid dehalogenase [Methyloprofundus sedimenti]|uniref:Haloacid dehalogenase n=1 Tax=Methyloprofundus sedimenti TaxID=1420851 RepID=A0A1V8M684_9GAMM|nr:HAD-IIA family hydrolase [Methyloprofundus sedimenti]OQK17075.1 haloacid dehalogenase [Methyloprofundus sedimenti]
MTAPFTNIHALIIDMDGVLWHGDQAIAGLKEFFQLIREQQIPFVLATNNASHTNEQYIKKLARMGVAVVAQEILTSGMATALYLAQHKDPAQTRVFVLGEDGAIQPLLEQGFTLTDLYQLNTEATPGQGADIVVCGKDESINWDKLSTATLNLRAGAEFIATNGDTTLPTELGLIQGNGAILAALHAATGCTPKVIGKPEPIIYQQALALLGSSAENTIAIGDRLDTDILGAVRTGMRSLMVLTGASTREDIELIDYAPTWVMDDLQAVTEALRNRR